MTLRAAYLDHNASAPLLPEARAAIVAALDVTGNPSSVHGPGRAVRALIDSARETIASVAGAEPKQVVFTGSATEAITQAIVGGVKAFPVSRVIVGATEHAAVLRAAEASGAPVEILPVDGQGLVDLDALVAALARADAADETVLAAVQAANNETGALQPLARIEALIGPTRHLLLIDAVQIFCKRPLDFAARAADMVAISGHKVGGPAGVGALLLKGHADGVRLIPGGGQEMGRRGGTEPVALIAGFAAAARAFSARYDASELAGLRNGLEAEIVRLAPGATVFSADVERLETTSNFAVPGVASATAMMGFDLEGVALSSGSACSSGKVARSHVLEAMGVDPALSACALRASFGWSSTRDDIQAFSKAFSILLSRRSGRDGKAA